MSSLNISLPDSLRQFVEARVESGSYSTASEYVRALIREDQDRARQLAELRQQIQVGIDQANRGQTAPLDIAEIRAEGRRRLARHRKG
jgi:antitoxin ParD1/3/4